MSEALLEVLESIVSSDSIYRDEPMSKHTTFRTGGVAKWFVEVENKEQLLKLFLICILRVRIILYLEMAVIS